MRNRNRQLTAGELAVKTYQPAPYGWFQIRMYAAGATLRIAWEAITADEAYATFAEFLFDDENDVPNLPPGWRKIEYDTGGERGYTVFRADWIAGFDIIFK